MVPNAQQFLSLLRMAMGELGLNNYTLASLAGVAKNAVAKLERGDHLDIRLNTASRLMGALKVEAEKQGKSLEGVLTSLREILEVEASTNG